MIRYTSGLVKVLTDLSLDMMLVSSPDNDCVSYEHG